MEVWVVGRERGLIAACPHCVVHCQQGFDKGPCQQFEKFGFLFASTFTGSLQLGGGTEGGVVKEWLEVGRGVVKEEQNVVRGVVQRQSGKRGVVKVIMK